MSINTQSTQEPTTPFHRKLWTTPQIQTLDINTAKGAAAGPLCDKHGSLSATTSHDYCTTK